MTPKVGVTVEWEKWESPIHPDGIIMVIYLRLTSTCDVIKEGPPPSIRQSLYLRPRHLKTFWRALKFDDFHNYDKFVKFTGTK